jgi:2-keto-4-pentenoate hydratase/2-oxohepta-3-ene-1,7-dioic acid hydratase in catechol pathway
VLLAIFRDGTGGIIVVGTLSSAGLVIKPAPQLLKTGDAVTIGIEKRQKIMAFTK